MTAKIWEYDKEYVEKIQIVSLPHTESSSSFRLMIWGKTSFLFFYCSFGSFSVTRIFFLGVSNAGSSRYTRFTNSMNPFNVQGKSLNYFCCTQYQAKPKQESKKRKLVFPQIINLNNDDDFVWGMLAFFFFHMFFIVISNSFPSPHDTNSTVVTEESRF